MPTNRDQKDVLENVDAAQTEADTGTTGDAAADTDLDLEGLDLTVETVEERISPSETNVFDK